MSEKFNPVSLKKYGIVRYKEGDFSDDGSRFKCYITPEGVEISYLNYEGEYYISPRVYDKFCRDYVTYKEWMQSGGSVLEEEYNGTCEVTAEGLVDNINKSIKLAKELVEKNKNYKKGFDYSNLNKARDNEVKMAKERLEKIKKDLIWYNLSKYDLERAAYYFNQAKNNIEGAEKRVFKDLSVTELKYYEERLENGYIVIGPDDFYLTELEELVKKSQGEPNDQE